MKTMIQIDKLHKSYGTRVLFEAADLVIADGARIGVIGRNGAGKSTLCRILVGEESADDGNVTLASELRLGHLRQDEPWQAGETVLGFLTRHSGREEWLAARLAARFQLKGPLLQEMIESLPGGFRTRVKLAAMLLDEPNFLVMDEPTNYLDLSTLILFERFLDDFTGGWLVVSHDREFIRRTCEETLEIEDGDCTLYPGDVHEYLEYKASMREQAIRFNQGIEAKKKHLERFINRFRAKASKATQAKSKMKQLSRLKSIEVAQPLSNVRIRVPRVPPRQGIAIRCEDLAIGYPGKRVAAGIRFEKERGKRVAILGDNGQGKTTLLRTMAGDLEPLGGSFRWGHEIEVGYYAQHVYGALDPERTILEHLSARADEGVTRQEVLDLAGNFLFRGEDVRKKIKVLSGGERARVCLASILLTRCDVLLLDEPTNHLDFETVEILAHSLRDYRGTIFFISHDRTFVNLLADAILEVRGGRVMPYPGSYGDFVARLEREADASDAPPKRAIHGAGGTACPPGAAPEAKPDDPARRAKEAAKRDIMKEREALRARIAAARERLKELDALQLASRREREEIETLCLKNPRNWTKTRRERFEELVRTIEETEAEWLALSVESDEMKKALLK
jgi:ATP-binding cassette subfamily F protein 3